MLSKIVFAAAMAVSTLSFAEVSVKQTEANFNTCVQQDSSWFQRWGQYVISFDKKEAYNSCGIHYRVKSTGCHVDRTWLMAGYYCEEITN